MRALWALDHALSARHREFGGRYGVTGSQRLVVRIVGQTPGVSAGEVARVLHVHPSTLTPTLQALLERGLLRREAHRDDRRRAVLSLTRRGERIDAAAAELIDRRVRAALARLSGSEVFAARRVLHTVAAAILGEADPAKALAAASRRSRASRAMAAQIAPEEVPAEQAAVEASHARTDRPARAGGAEVTRSARRPRAAARS
jgi:DNA-binding MarR family transcriptional regulator